MKIKAVPYQKTIHHKEVEPYEPSYDTYETRFRIVSEETGEVLDDANGYGYKTIKKAYSAYYYKTMDKNKKKEYLDKKEHIKQWLREHKGFCNALNEYSFEITKGSWSPEAKVDEKLVKWVLEQYKLEPDFSASELLKVFQSRW